MRTRRWLWPLLFGLLGCAAQTQDCGQLEQDQAVGNAGCLIVQGGKVLLVQQQLGGSWGIPGGTADAGERAACTAARETQEETGLAVRVLEPLQVLDNGFHIYRCAVDAGALPLPPDSVEIRATGWFDALQRQNLPWRFPAQRGPTEALIQALE